MDRKRIPFSPQKDNSPAFSDPKDENLEVKSLLDGSFSNNDTLVGTQQSTTTRKKRTTSSRNQVTCCKGWFAVEKMIFRLLLCMFILFFLMRSVWFMQGVFPQLFDLKKKEKAEIEFQFLFWSQNVLLLVSGSLFYYFHDKRNKVDFDMDTANWKVFKWLRGKIWMRSVWQRLDFYDLIFLSGMFVLHLYSVVGKLQIDANTGKLRKSGYLKCITKALGMNGLYAMVSDDKSGTRACYGLRTEILFVVCFMIGFLSDFHVQKLIFS
jgi:hypothetical protein